MRAVLDASAAVAAVLRQARAGPTLSKIAEAEVVLAPDLFVPEVVNAFWKYHRFSGLDAAACDELIEDACALVDTMVGSRSLRREAFLLARLTQRPAYDMFYLALARRENATLLTADTTLRTIAMRQGVDVL